MTSLPWFYQTREERRMATKLVQHPQLRSFVFAKDTDGRIVTLYKQQILMEASEANKAAVVYALAKATTPEVVCPVCKQGQLVVENHSDCLWIACTTENCIRWIE